MFSYLQPSTSAHPRWATGVLAMVFVGSSVLTAPALAVPAPDTAGQLVAEEVVDDGAHLHTLRYTPAAGEHGVYTVSSGGRAVLTFGEHEMDTPIPAMVSTFSYVVEDVAESGDFTTRTTLLDQGLANIDDLDAELAELMSELLSETTDIAFVHRMNPLGVITDAKLVGEAIERPAEEEDLMPKIDALYGTFLPEEPVGVGSTWQVESEYRIGEVALEQIMTFEIVEMTHDTVTINAVHESFADPQEFANALSPEDLDVNVLSLDFTSKSEFVLDRSRGNRVIESSIESSYSSSVELVSDDTTTSVMHQMYSMNVHMTHQAQ